MRRIRRTIKGIAWVIHEIVTRTISWFGSLSLPQAITNGLNYVKAFGKAKQKTNLPSGYTEYEYIHTSGKYFVTDYYPSNKTEVKTKIFLDSQPWSPLVTRWTTAPTNDTFWFYMWNVSNRLTFFYGRYSDGRYTNAEWVKTNMEHSIYMWVNSIVLDWTSYSTTRDTFTSTYPIYIGAFNQTSTSLAGTLTGRIYKVEFIESWNVVRRYIPCKNANNEIWLYETVTGTFISSEGTGTLKAWKIAEGSDTLPSTYTRLDYIQATGTQYIDSGVVWNFATNKIEQNAVVEYTTSSSNRELMWTNWYGFWGKDASNKIEAALWNTTVTDSALAKNNISWTTDPNGNKLTLNVNSNQYTSTASTFVNADYAYYIFALWIRVGSGASASFFCKAKVYSYTISLDDEVVCDLVPCKRNSDNVLWMYDLVSWTFKTNAGTGTFTAGSDYSVLNPSNPQPIICNNWELKMIWWIPWYKVLDYAEFSSSYIDTGIIPNVDTKTEIKFLFTSSVGTQNLIGSRMSSTGSDRSAFAVYVMGGTNMRFDWSSWGRYVYNLDYTQDMIVTQDWKDNYVDWELKNTQTATPLLNSTVSLYVWALNQYNGSPVSFLKARVYYFKVRQNGTTISRDCIPVQRLSDNKVWFWDKVNGEFLEPQWTRDLVAWPEKSGIWTLWVVWDTETIVDSLNNTATAENLLSIQGYEDVQEILSGEVKRNVWVMVLNGSEDWSTDTYGWYRRFYFTNSIGQYSEAIPLICTHYIWRQGNKQTPNSVFLPTTGRLVIYPDASQNINTVADWQTYLQTQYSGGNPVMIVYPLATETTETVTWQTLNTNTWTNTIAITQASIDPSELKLEVEYQALI